MNPTIPATDTATDTAPAREIAPAQGANALPGHYIRAEWVRPVPEASRYAPPGGLRALHAVWYGGAR